MTAAIALIGTGATHLTGIGLLYVLPLWLLVRSWGMTAGLVLAFVVVIAGVGVQAREGLSLALLDATSWLVSLFAVTLIIGRVESSLSAAQRESQHDPLTQVLNRKGFEARVETAIEESASSGASIALALIDCDAFKSVNDSLGHPFGDRVLCVLGEELGQNCRPDGNVGRLGGDEFAVLFVGLTELEVRSHLDHVRSRFTTRTDGLGRRCTFSYGLATDADRPKTLLGLLGAADSRMYSTRELRRGAQPNPRAREQVHAGTSN